MAFIIRTRRDELYVKYCRQPGTRLNAILTDIEQGMSLLDICIRYGTDFETVLLCNAVYKKYKGVGVAQCCVDKWHEKPARPELPEAEPEKQCEAENGRQNETMRKRKASPRNDRKEDEAAKQSAEQSCHDTALISSEKIWIDLHGEGNDRMGDERALTGTDVIGSGEAMSGMTCQAEDQEKEEGVGIVAQVREMIASGMGITRVARALGITRTEVTMYSGRYYEKN